MRVVVVVLVDTAVIEWLAPLARVDEGIATKQRKKFAVQTCLALEEFHLVKEVVHLYIAAEAALTIAILRVVLNHALNMIVALHAIMHGA